MTKQKKHGLKLTGILVNAIILGSLVVALTSGFRFI
jgi:hypothetical protein